MHKHYVRLNVNNHVIKGFSDSLEQPIETDVNINENGGRHFEINGVTNPIILNEFGIYLYKYGNGNIVKRSEIDIQADIDNLPPAPPKPEERIEQLENMILMMMEAM